MFIKVWIVISLVIRNLVIRNYESTTTTDNCNKYLHSEKKNTKKKYEWYEHHFMTYVNDLKYDNFVNDISCHFSRVKVVNIDIIHHECCGDKLQNSRQYYETIHNKDFINSEIYVRDCTISSAIRSEHDNIHFENDFLKYNVKKDIEEVEDYLKLNGIFIKKNRKKATDDYKKLKFYFFLVKNGGNRSRLSPISNLKGKL